ncbi:MAG: N-acetyltransferase family protein [Pseudohongiellaceae bacterium]
MTIAENIVTVRDASTDDAAAIVAIYNDYIATSVTTFEEQPVSAARMAVRMETVAGANLPWLVGESPQGVLGYSYATPWRSRSAYRFTTETSVYLAKSACAQGLGTSLYTELFARLRTQGIQVAIGGIALPNEASIALHEKMGMVKVAHFSRVGFKFDRWIDVGYWEILLDS